jgi:OFA family oxalate/formate antiporter-like MFS transporter
MPNRWFQLVAALVAMLMIANLQYAWTLFVHPIEAATGWHLPAIQWAFSLFILLQTWVQPLDGWLLDRLGPRRCIAVAGVLCGAGWGLMGRATTLPQLYALYAVAGVGAAFVYSGCVGLALRWFPDRRGMATGIIAAAFGGGSALFIPIISRVIDARGYGYAFASSGILQGAVIVVAAQFLRYPDAEFASAHRAAPATTASVRRNAEQFTTRQMLRSPHFYILYAMFVSMATGGLFVTANAAPLQRSWGLAAAALTAALTLGPIANGASRIAWGVVSDRLGRESTMVVAFTLQALALLGVLTLGRTSDAWFTITLVVTFFTWGEIFSLFPATLSDYYGTRHATSNYGFLYTAKGVAAIIGGGLSAVLFERSGSWSAVLYGSVALALASAAFALYLRQHDLPRLAPIAGAALVDPIRPVSEAPGRPTVAEDHHA